MSTKKDLSFTESVDESNLILELCHRLECLTGGANTNYSRLKHIDVLTYLQVLTEEKGGSFSFGKGTCTVRLNNYNFTEDRFTAKAHLLLGAFVKALEATNAKG